MPQSPLLTDAVQIEPGSGDTLTISRESSDGSMKFVDALITSGVLLSQLVGMRVVSGVFVVGRAGDGAAYTSIQDALDAIPDSSSAAAPSLVWVMPGVYTENLVLQKDGVVLASPGGAKLINDGDSDTLTISASLDTIPKKVVLRNLEVECDENANACIRVLGADTFASGTVTVVNAPLVAGDTLTVGGTVLTGIAGTRASGSDNFSTLGSTVTALAAEISAALNDSLNSWADDIEASVAGAVITIQAQTAGSGGNSIGLASSTTPSGGLTLSGATLTGGSSDGSLVVSEDLLVEGCTLLATGVGGYQINADTANFIRVREGTWRGSSSTSSARVADCASFRVYGLEWANDFNLSYDTANDEPNAGTSAYEVKNCGRVNDVTVNLEGLGSLVLADIPGVGDVTQAGSQTVKGMNCELGDFVVEDTTVARLVNCTWDLLYTDDSATIAVGQSVLSSTVSAAVQLIMVHDARQPDTDYTVLVDVPQAGVLANVTAKTATNFTVDFSAATTGDVYMTVLRQM
jgi:hypothetical protein